MHSFNFYFPTKIFFGCGKIANLNSVVPSNIIRILIVTDNNVANHTSILEMVQSYLGNRQISLFKKVRENPDFCNVEDGGRIARDAGVELIIGIGGGSSMDAAKGIALLATNKLNLREYLMGQPLLNAPLPVVCIPTTSGSGSEATPYAVFTDIEGNNKIGYSNQAMFPLASIVDPELTYSMPENVIISTGLDALTHAVESYLSTDSFLISDVLALHIIKSVLANLKSASLKDRMAMEIMSYNAMLAGIVITNVGTILPHIMGYCITVYHGIAHGRASAVLLPAVLDFLRCYSTAKDKIRRLDEIFVHYGGIRNFIEDLGVSTKLSSYGVRLDELKTFAQNVIVKRDIIVTPAPVNFQDILNIYQSAL